MVTVTPETLQSLLSSCLFWESCSSFQTRAQDTQSLFMEDNQLCVRRCLVDHNLFIYFDRGSENYYRFDRPLTSSIPLYTLKFLWTYLLNSDQHYYLHHFYAFRLRSLYSHSTTTLPLFCSTLHHSTPLYRLFTALYCRSTPLYRLSPPLYATLPTLRSTLPSLYSPIIQLSVPYPLERLPLSSNDKNSPSKESKEADQLRHSTKNNFVQRSVYFK